MSDIVDGRPNRDEDMTARLAYENPQYAGRWGGEEFAVLLPNTHEDGAFQVAEDIRTAVRATGEVTISIGLVELDLNKSLAENVALADKALYFAKENGRDQVVPYHDLPEFEGD